MPPTQCWLVCCSSEKSGAYLGQAGVVPAPASGAK